MHIQHFHTVKLQKKSTTTDNRDRYLTSSAEAFYCGILCKILDSDEQKPEKAMESYVK